jgi:hypothetical protein
LAQLSGVYRSNFLQESNYTASNEGMRVLFLYICLQASRDDGVDDIEGNL